jgi:hypothetical protein
MRKEREVVDVGEKERTDSGMEGERERKEGGREKEREGGWMVSV